MRFLDLINALIRNELHPLHRNVTILVLFSILFSLELFVRKEVFHMSFVVADGIVSVHKLDDDLAKVEDVLVW